MLSAPVAWAVVMQCALALYLLPLLLPLPGHLEAMHLAAQPPVAVLLVVVRVMQAYLGLAQCVQRGVAWPLLLTVALLLLPPLLRYVGLPGVLDPAWVAHLQALLPCSASLS